jgi:spore coat polysaccharide biosynthesis protein SpsF
MPTGTAVDVMDAGLLRELRTIGETHPVTLARSNPKEWGTVLTDNPSWEDVSDAHIAVDTPKDYWSLQDAVDVNGDDPYQIAKWVA